MRRLVVASLACVLLSGTSVAAQGPVRVYAAGSLRAALTAIADRSPPSMAFRSDSTSVPPACSGSPAQADKALRLILFILSPDGQQILARYGFSAPTRAAP